MNRSRSNIAFSVLVCVTLTMGASHVLATQDTVAVSTPDWCDATLEEQFLPAVAAEANEVINAFCNGEESADVQILFNRFIAKTNHWFDPFGGFAQGSLNQALLDDTRQQGQSIALSLNLNDAIAFEGRAFSPASEETCEKVAIRQSAGARCFEVLEEFLQHYNAAQRASAFAGRGEVVANLQSLERLWDNYLNHTKGQTPLELAINGRFYRKGETAKFSAPPKWQQIVLHPSVLFQYAEAANDGERTTEILGLELYGINNWQQDKWYLPSGVSLLATYRDRTDFTDSGLGVALHFNSNYTIGYTKHGSADAISLSMDLVKFFQSRRQTLQRITGLTR